MRYAQIRELDISNGENIGIALFVQGCPFHCCNCFNPETWEFDSGKQWIPEVEDKFIKLASRPYIKRISILGGEPLAEKNLDGILHLVNEIRLSFGNSKTIWLYTGYEWEHIFDPRWHYHPKTQEKLSIGRFKRQQIIAQCDVIVDGPFIDSQKDLSLKWCGSKNQRVINVQESIKEKRIILWDS